MPLHDRHNQSRLPPDSKAKTQASTSKARPYVVLPSQSYLFVFDRSYSQVSTPFIGQYELQDFQVLLVAYRKDILSSAGWVLSVMPKDQSEKRALVRMLLEHHHSRTDTAPQSKAGNTLHGTATEELRIYFCKIIGSSGFHALFSRALKQATNQAPELKALRLQPDGSLDGLADIDRHGAQDAEEIILAELLELLVTFIGKGLTLRLLSDLWPGVSSDIASLISRKG